jgi:hypothetical protein
MARPETRLGPSIAWPSPTSLRKRLSRPAGRVLRQREPPAMLADELARTGSQPSHSPHALTHPHFGHADRLAVPTAVRRRARVASVRARVGDDDPGAHLRRLPISLRRDRPRQPDLAMEPPARAYERASPPSVHARRARSSNLRPPPHGRDRAASARAAAGQPERGGRLADSCPEVCDGSLIARATRPARRRRLGARPESERAEPWPRERSRPSLPWSPCRRTAGRWPSPSRCRSPVPRA